MDVIPCVQIPDFKDAGVIQLHHQETGYHLPYNCSQTIVAPGSKVVKLLAKSKLNSLPYNHTDHQPQLHRQL